MSVELDPAELGFRRPFQNEVSQVLKLRNPNSNPVAFKVKTTAPKQYCVRPNSGRIEPRGEVEVQVLLQAMKEDPPLDAKCRDKFLVQSVAVTPDREFNNVASIWSHIEETAKSAIQEKKIRVVFLSAQDGSQVATPAKVNGLSSEHSARSPSPEAVTPQRNGAGDSTPASANAASNVRDSAYSAAQSVQSTLASASSAVANAVPTSAEELKQQLAAANAQIAKLKDDATQGIRQRKTGDTQRAAPGSTTTTMQQSPTGGVPVQYVAGLCLLSFLMAYFFF